MRLFKFIVERWIQKGILHQMLLMAGLIALVSAAGGLAAWSATPGFENPAEAAWWAFLRLTDPGYLGDDEGAVLRTISTIVTVLGYVIFMGSLIAIMTQWLARTIRQLESGLTPITMKDHVVILGWTNRTPEIVLKLMSARGRLRRFLDRHEVGKLRIVILSDIVTTERRLELREHLGKHWKEGQIYLRSGSSLLREHLERLDILRASVVVVPGADFELGGAELTDTRVVKTLLTLHGLFRAVPEEERPHVVAEIFDVHKVPLARKAVGQKIEIIASDRIISQLISQSVRHRGLARVLVGLVSEREGNTIYVRGFPELAGADPRALSEAFPEAILLGFVRNEGRVQRTCLNPREATLLEPGDLLVLLAASYDQCRPVGGIRSREALTHKEVPAEAPEQGLHRILILGWSHKIRSLVVELGDSGAGRFELTIMSRTEIEEREQLLKGANEAAECVRIRHVRGDYSIESELSELDPTGFDHVLLLASNWMASSEEADARTILGYVLLRALLEDVRDPPEILVELLDPDNAQLFLERDDIIVVSPRVLSDLLAHVALRPELNSVFGELFGATGAELDLRSAVDFGLSGRALAFPEIQRAAAERGCVALGLACAGGAAAEVHLNPERTRSWTLTPEDRLIVLIGPPPEPAAK